MEASPCRWMFKMTCWAPEYGRLGGDFSDFERDIVLVPHRLVYWDFPPQFTESCLRKRNYPVSSISLGKGALLMLQVRGKRPIYFEVMGTSSPKWTIENWRTVAWSAYWFLLQHSDDRIECGVNNKSMDSGAAGGVMWWIFSWHTLARLVLNWASFKHLNLHEYP